MSLSSMHDHLQNITKALLPDVCDCKNMAVRGTNISLNILSHPSEHADPASLLPSSLPSSLSYLLQQCNEGHLDVLEEVMDIMKTLVENGGWNSCSGISVLHMM